MASRQMHTLIALLASTTLAVAGPVADRVAEAEALAQTDALAAHAAVREAMADFNAGLRFEMANPVFITASNGYGMIETREPVFKPGEKLVAYAEPVGLGWKPGGRGWIASFRADVEIIDNTGRLLGGQKDFGVFGFDSRVRNQEVTTTLTLDISGIPPGQYNVRYVFHDDITQRSTDFTLPFTLTE